MFAFLALGRLSRLPPGGIFGLFAFAACGKCRAGWGISLDSYWHAIVMRQFAALSFLPVLVIVNTPGIKLEFS
jgi:hypothetical protein